MHPHTRRQAALVFFPCALAIAATLAAACTDDTAVAFSETVSTKLPGIKDGDLVNGTASVMKNVNTEPGNPYADFLKTAKSRLGGRDPSSVTPTLITVRVDADSKKVAQLEQVFTNLEVFFADSQTTIPVARLDAPQGTSVVVPLLLAVDYEPTHDLDAERRPEGRRTRHHREPRAKRLRAQVDARHPLPRRSLRAPFGAASTQRPDPRARAYQAGPESKRSNRRDALAPNAAAWHYATTRRRCVTVVRTLRLMSVLRRGADHELC